MRPWFVVPRVIVAVGLLLGLGATRPASAAVCGDAIPDLAEECDDGNVEGGDGCDQNCRKPHAFVLAGQSNMEGRSTQNQDLDEGRVTSPDPSSSHVSRVFRFRYTFDTGAALPPWVDANNWPCADSQCTDTPWGPPLAGGVPGSCATRTAANNVSIDRECRCHCGTSNDTWAGQEEGSAWPQFAKRWMQDRDREVTFISVNRGATALVATLDSGVGPSWDPNIDCTGRTWPTGSENAWKDEAGDLFCAVFEAVTQSGVGDSLKAVLWYQGEQDAAWSITEAAYEAALNTLVDEIWARLGVPTIIAPLSLRTYPLDAYSTLSEASATGAIRQAQLDVIASNPHAYRGPETNDLEHLDTVHIQDVMTLGDRWADSVQDALDPQTGCDNGIDDDGDGFVDFPDDPACNPALGATRESTQCQDGIDNDGDGRMDYDGGASHHAGAPVTEPDPDCVEKPYKNSERTNACGLGAELVLLLAALRARDRFRRRAGA